MNSGKVEMNTRTKNGIKHYLPNVQVKQTQQITRKIETSYYFQVKLYAFKLRRTSIN